MTSDGQVIFVGNGRCYHTMDWYRTAQQVLAPRPLMFATDLVESEGHVRLLRDDDQVIPLFNVDSFLMSRQSRFGNVWRNALKFALLPVQVRLLKRLYRRFPTATYHAHTMYYMVACWLARVPFIGTPQGSEILVRPTRSRVYRWFASHALRAADTVIVDSVAMQDGVWALSGREADRVQFGVDVQAIADGGSSPSERSGILSIRGLTANYRISEILAARASSTAEPRVDLVYPFWFEEYAARVRGDLRPGDQDLGRLPRAELYAAMRRALLVASIPISDSSPRSVYEAIFSGACVAVSPNAFLDILPECMRSRLVIVDATRSDWLDGALERARAVVAQPYVPSQEALDLFDQRRSIQRLAASFYRPVSAV
jgi:hypothetical protein